MPKFLADRCVWVIGCFSKHDVTDIVAAGMEKSVREARGKSFQHKKLAGRRNESCRERALLLRRRKEQQRGPKLTSQ